MITQMRKAMHANATSKAISFRGIVARLRSSIARLFVEEDQRGLAGGAEFATARASRLFVQALHENSNLELDWLWYTANITRDAERRYCLGRARYQSRQRPGAARPGQAASAGRGRRRDRAALGYGWLGQPRLVHLGLHFPDSSDKRRETRDEKCFSPVSCLLSPVSNYRGISAALH
jgi:hypothetical protein